MRLSSSPASSSSSLVGGVVMLVMLSTASVSRRCCCLALVPPMTMTMTSRRSVSSRHRSAHYSRLFLASSDVAVVADADASSSTPAASTANSDSRASSTTTTTKKKVQTRRILSGVQPTGSLHLGNYLGAIKQWVDFQNTGVFAGARTPTSPSGGNGNDEEATEEEEGGVEIIHENFFCVVDMHAITVPQNPSELEESSLASAALYIAAGIDPTKSKIFIQSHVSAHAELAWLLNCITPMNWLERMIQYKDKAAGNKKDTVGVGLFTYPVLMAADILLYQADRVPVGEDQRQHLELARDIVRRFNNDYCKGNAYKTRCKKAGLSSRPVFTEPEAMIISSSSDSSSSSNDNVVDDKSSDGNNNNNNNNSNNTGGVGGVARVMSLTDGTSKMSKSDPADNSRINILDTPDVIRDKIKRCKTDSMAGGLTWDDPNRPEATNLLNIYAAVQPHRTKEDIISEVRGMKWGEFKPKLAEAIVEHLQPIQRRYAEVRADETYLRTVLNEGAIAAEEIAQQTLKAAKVAMGFTIRK